VYAQAHPPDFPGCAEIFSQEFMRNNFVLICLVAVSFAPPKTVLAESAATNAVVMTPDYLGQLAEEMRTNNPALRAASAMTNAAAAGAAAVRTWEDPMVVAGGLAAREDMRADEGDIIYGVEQKLPLFGKPKLERNVARAELATETANLDYQFQKMRVELAKAAFRAALADQVVAIGEQDLAWLDTMKQLLESNARVGQASLVEILQIQNEQGKRANQLQTDRGQLAQEKITLNRLLNRDTQSQWPDFALPPVAGPVSFSPRLVEFALKYEPKTLIMQRQVQQAEAMVEVTRRQNYPDVSAGVEARNASGDGSWRQAMFLLRMNLPWVNKDKIKADIRRDQAKLSAAQFDLADYQLGVRQELHQLTVKVDSARREALLYRDQIIPRTESTLETVRSNWQTGQNSFREVLDTRRMLLEGRLMFVRAVSEQYQMLSELVLCCGLGDLNALSMIGAEPETTSPVTPAPSPTNSTSIKN
jgi:outer membrane protein TolC